MYIIYYENEGAEYFFSFSETLDKGIMADSIKDALGFQTEEEAWQIWALVTAKAAEAKKNLWKVVWIDTRIKGSTQRTPF